MSVHQDGSLSSGKGGVPCPTGNLSGRQVCQTVAGGRWNYGSCYTRVALDSANPLGYVKDASVEAVQSMWGASQFEKVRAEHLDAQGNFTGAIIECATPYVCDTADICTTSRYFWSPFSGAAVSAQIAALDAVARMRLRAPEIGMTGGDPQLDQTQYVGMFAWMWAADPGESTTGPITRSGSDGPLTVTATAVLDRTVWSMGNGDVVTCSGPNAAGTPMEDRFAGQPSPTCGYVYERTSIGMPREEFTVTVTAYWTVTWAGGGQSGTIPIQVSRSTQKKVAEIQAIIVPNPGGRS